MYKIPKFLAFLFIAVFLALASLGGVIGTRGQTANVRSLPSTRASDRVLGRKQKAAQKRAAQASNRGSKRRKTESNDSSNSSKTSSSAATSTADVNERFTQVCADNNLDPATHRLANDTDFQNGLVNDNRSIRIVCFLDPANPTVFQVCGSNCFEESFGNDDPSTDPSAYGVLKDAKNRFASLANYYYNRMSTAYNQNHVTFSVLQKGFGTSVKALGLLVPEQTAADGSTVTREHVVNSLDHPTIGAAAGEGRSVDCLSGMSHHVDEPVGPVEVTRVREFWDDLHGTAVTGNSKCFFIVGPPVNSNTVVRHGGRFNTAPGTPCL